MRGAIDERVPGNMFPLVANGKNVNRTVVDCIQVVVAELNDLRIYGC